MEILPRFLIQYPMKNLISYCQSQCQNYTMLVINYLQINRRINFLLREN